MRRFVPTLLLIIALLVIGGLAVSGGFSPLVFTKGYIPTLDSSTEALILVIGIAATIFVMIGMGATMAFGLYRLAQMQAALGAAASAGAAESEAPAAKAPARAAKASPAAKAAAKSAGDAPAQTLLADTRSVVIFWIVLVVVVAGFLVIRYWGQLSGAYLPGLGALARIELFRLPGEHIDGLPPFVAGPGDPVTALHLFIAVLGAAVVTTLVMGLGLARGIALLDEKVKTGEQLPRTPVDRLLAEVDRRVSALRGPKSWRPPANPIDQILIGLDVLLVLVIVGLIAAWIIPSYGSVAAVDNAIEATRIAAQVTPTQPGPPGKSPVEFLKAEFAALPAGDASAGQAVFTSAGCAACHALEPDVKIVGPSLAGVSQRAGTRRPELEAQLYLYESIINPNAYLVEGFQADVMPKTFKQTLAPDPLADVIAFLMTK